jgi:hypothetical protein
MHYVTEVVLITYFEGQSGPMVQKAGHVPQMPPGICAMSAMIKPWLYDLFDWIRMLDLPFGETLVLSTPNFTESAEVVIMPDDCAVF